MTLKLAPKLSLPDEAVTQAIGILAKRGGGKSNAGAVMAEEMHAAGLPFVVVDPVGAWWGLRSSADGKGTGLSIPIFGGYRGDVPLEPQGAQLVADLIVNENLSVVLDVSAFDSENAKRQFLWKFAERLYQLKGKPGHDTPLHMFLEEADDYIPQRATGEVARCLGAFERIVKRGRGRGLGVTLITQRGAELNKAVLTQIETLIVLRTVAALDIAAIGGWLKYHGQSDEILSSLSSLEPGEAWVWSPWLDLTERVQIRRRRTFDSGATPSVKAKRAVATLADVDLGAITAQMKETIERAKADDPAELRRTITGLRRQLAEIENKAPVPSKEPEVLKIPVITTDVANRLDAAVLKLGELWDNELDKHVRAIVDAVHKISNPLVTILDEAERLVVKHADGPSPAPERKWSVSPPGRPAGPPTRVSRQARGSDPGPSSEAPNSEPGSDDTITIGKGEQAVLAVLRQWPAGRTYNELAFLAGYSARASTIRSILTRLRKAGYIDTGQPVHLTEAGAAAAGGWEPPPTGEALLDHWRSHPRMGKGERAVLDVLIAAYPQELEHDELADRAGYSADASTLRSILTRLRKLGLVEKRGRRLAPEFAEAIAA